LAPLTHEPLKNDNYGKGYKISWIIFNRTKL
jgi:hypothetical protein